MSCLLQCEKEPVIKIGTLGEKFSPYLYLWFSNSSSWAALALLYSWGSVGADGGWVRVWGKQRDVFNLMIRYDCLSR